MPSGAYPGAVAAVSAGVLAWDASQDGCTLLPLRRLKPIEWRDHPLEPDRIQVFLPKRKKWARMKRDWLPLLEAADEGANVPQIAARCRAVHPDWPPFKQKHIVRKVVSTLRKGGLIEILTPEPPAVFHGRYRVVKRLGEGGLGIVWLCEDEGAPEGPRPVAIKHAWRVVGDFGDADKGLRSEASMLHRFEHPAIPRFFDEFEVDGRYHLVREYVAGDSLSHAAKRGGLATHARLSALLQICDVLQFIRQKGYFYLDLKTSNFFFREDGETLVMTDVGGIKRAPTDPAAEIVTRVGTHRYMAPETLWQSRASERSIVYGIARVHYELACGSPPRIRSTPDEMTKTLTKKGASEAETLLFRASVSKEPAGRPATIAEVRDRLQGLA